MRPLVGRSKPAIMRSVVVLPQPDGPTIVKNSPGGMCRSMLSTAVTSPKSFVSVLEPDFTVSPRSIATSPNVAASEASLAPAKRL